jgi:ferrous iron transport protein A
MTTPHDSAAVPQQSSTATSPAPSTALDRLPLHTPALVTGLRSASGEQEEGTVLRLMEIGFLPGEAVRVIARGGLGVDPIAVRVGQATFALRRSEASMVQVQVGVEVQP